MASSDFTEELMASSSYRKGDPTTLYWIENGKVFYGNKTLVRGAHLPSFRFFQSGFAKDQAHCYCIGRKLVGANPNAFHALNFTYAKDDKHVWTLGGKAPDADPTTFRVCDDGAHRTGTIIVPYGYGKDKSRVYYYNFDGKPKWVRKADAETFVSLGDGHFGKDRDSVFCAGAILPQVKAISWAKIGGLYSRVESRVFYGSREIRPVDCETFEAVPGQFGAQLARDRSSYFWNDRIAERAEFVKMTVNPTCFTEPSLSSSPSTAWRTSAVVSVAKAIRRERAFDRMPILADGLEEAGCTNQDVLAHCRGPGPHVRGCWVLDLLVGKE